MLRKLGIVLGAVALTTVAYITAFAVEEVQRPIIENDTAGRADEPTWTVCSNGCDYTSIQAAVDAASSGDLIQLGAETYFENVCVGGGADGYRYLTIRGLGIDATVVDGSGQNRPVFAANGGFHSCGFGSVILGLQDMTIQNSAACGVEAVGSCYFGCPYYYSSDVWLQNCVIRDNGCGIANQGDSSVSISTTTISGNENHGFDSRGYYESYLDSSTVSGNGGYGIRTETERGVFLSHSTVSGNGAGVGLFRGWSRVVISRSTIADNLGPGLLVTETFPWYPSELEVSGSIVANNQGGNCWTTSGGHNLSSDPCQDAGSTDIVATDPLLVPLADNGGPTRTHALAPSSPAIDAGGDECEPTDQRGVTRPQGGDGDGIAKCDIGAFEFDRLTVNVEIKPNSLPNSINPGSRGVIPVAILGSDAFDVADVDVTTLAFGPGAAPITHLNGHSQDVNCDGIMDLMMHFRTQDTGIACGDESVTLTGETLDGQALEGSDSIQTVGCRATRRLSIWMKDQDTPDSGRRDGPVSIERKD